MAKSLKERVSDSRRLLENPYAHIEYLEEFSTQAHQENVDAAAAPESSGSPKRIEPLVAELHSSLWRNRSTFWPKGVPRDPVDVLDPAMALEIYGFKLSLENGLGQYRDAEGIIEVAGIVDHDRRVVRISQQFPLDVQLFTAAHELGHVALGHSRGGLHRDRPLSGLSRPTDPVEVEANKFAAHFLMPRKLVTSRFDDQFLGHPFLLTEDTAFALSSKSLSVVRQTIKTRRDLAHLLANAERYNGGTFISLANQFRVSAEAMAIRLEELCLVEFDG